MITPMSRLILQMLTVLVMLQLALTHASAIPLDTDFNQDTSLSTDTNDELSPMSKEEFREDMARQLLILQQAEATIAKRIQELEAERIALSQRKRSHFNNMCILNVVTCFGRRR